MAYTPHSVHAGFRAPTSHHHRNKTPPKWRPVLLVGGIKREAEPQALLGFAIRSFSHHQPESLLRPAHAPRFSFSLASLPSLPLASQLELGLPRMAANSRVDVSRIIALPLARQIFYPDAVDYPAAYQLLQEKEKAGFLPIWMLGEIAPDLQQSVHDSWQLLQAEGKVEEVRAKAEPDFVLSGKIWQALHPHKLFL